MFITSRPTCSDSISWLMRRHYCISDPSANWHCNNLCFRRLFESGDWFGYLKTSWIGIAFSTGLFCYPLEFESEILSLSSAWNLRLPQTHGRKNRKQFHSVSLLLSTHLVDLFCARLTPTSWPWRLGFSSGAFSISVVLFLPLELGDIQLPPYHPFAPPFKGERRRARRAEVERRVASARHAAVQGKARTVWGRSPASRLSMRDSASGIPTSKILLL